MTTSALRAHLTAHELEPLVDPIDAAENMFDPGFEIAHAVTLGLENRFSVEVEWMEDSDDLPFDAWALVSPTQTAFIAPGTTPLDCAESLMTAVAEMVSVQLSNENIADTTTTWKVRFGSTFRGVEDGECVASGFLLSIHAKVERI